MLEVVTNHQCSLGEGPVWNSSTNTICWIDIINGRILEFQPATQVFETTELHQMVGAIAVCTNGELLVAAKNGIGILNRRSGELDIIASPESHLPDNRFNDGKCDPEGRFWIGSMAIDETPHAGNLYVLDANHGVTKKIEHTTISNGMAWSPDRKTFYYIDTPTSTVVAYDYTAATGAITNKRVACIIDKAEGYPDGMTIDTEGMLWIAHWAGWQLSRWNPVTGEKIYSLSLPVANVTACTFGGADLGDLYITTARHKLSETALKEQPLAGCLFVWKNCGFKGMAAFEYKNTLL